MSTPTVTAEFAAELARLGSPESLTGLVHGIESALAWPAGSLARPGTAPLCGYYFTATAERFLAYFQTPHAFVRYEVAGGQSLTVTIPRSRVSRVVEQAGGERLLLTVELDADAAHGLLETQSETQAEGAVRAGAARGVLRVSRTVYEIAADTPAEVVRLASFSRAVRAAAGS